MYEIKSHELVYKGRIIDVYKDEVVIENDNIATREYISHGGASAILAVDKQGYIIFVKQYRHPARELVLEIPAGTLEKDEDPKICAIRELEEETSFKPGKITFMTKMYSAIGFCTEILYIYLAENLLQGEFNLDPEEFVTVEKYTLDEAIELIYKGEIKDAKTIVALMMYKNMITQ